MGDNRRARKIYSIDAKTIVPKTPTILKAATFIIYAIFFFGLGVLFNSVVFSRLSIKSSSTGDSDDFDLPQTGRLKIDDDGQIRSPINGIPLSELEYEKLSQNIPHAVMISNNKSARTEQYGLSYADIVYEAQVEGGITRFMAIFWSNQEGYIIKPVRSVRKYFFDWAFEYGNIPVSFTGFARTSLFETNAWGAYAEYGIRVTIWDWPFKWDEECISKHPRMHCKRAEVDDLYELFSVKGWTYNSWENFEKDSWDFDEEIDLAGEPVVNELSYDFMGPNDWSSRWVYNDESGFYEKYDPYNPHIDMVSNTVISASTVIVMKVPRIYTYDSEQRVLYETLGSGDALVFRDGIRIDAVWTKNDYNKRTEFHVKQSGDNNNYIKMKPGLIWIAVVPSENEIKWK